MARYKQRDDNFTQKHPGGSKGSSLGGIIVVMILVGGACAGNYYFMQQAKEKQQEAQNHFEQELETLKDDSQVQIEKATLMARKQAEESLSSKIKDLEGQIADYEAAMPMFESYKREAMEAVAKNDQLQQHFEGLSAQVKSLEAQLEAAEKKAKSAANSDALFAVKKREDALIDQLKKSQLRIRDQKESIRQQGARIRQLEQTLQAAQNNVPAK